MDFMHKKWIFIAKSWRRTLKLEITNKIIFSLQRFRTIYCEKFALQKMMNSDTESSSPSPRMDSVISSFSTKGRKSWANSPLYGGLMVSKTSLTKCLIRETSVSLFSQHDLNLTNIINNHNFTDQFFLIFTAKNTLCIWPLELHSLLREDWPIDREASFLFPAELEFPEIRIWLQKVEQTAKTN